jgi:hypothetical protein
MITKEIAEFLGWHLGDGCISVKGGRYQFTLTGDLIEEYAFYKEVIVPTFNKIFNNYLKNKAILRSYPSVGVCGIYITNKDFVNYLQNELKLMAGKKLHIQLPKFENKEQMKSFLRGLFDTDGSIYFCRSNFKPKNPSLYNIFHYKPKIKLATISKELILGVYEMLQSLDFSPRLYSPRKQRNNEHMMYAVVLDKAVDVKRWINEIGFQSVKHSSKIAIWKKYGFVPPKTTLLERFKILNKQINPLEYYPAIEICSLEEVKIKLAPNNTIFK